MSEDIMHKQFHLGDFWKYIKELKPYAILGDIRGCYFLLKSLFNYYPFFFFIGIVTTVLLFVLTLSMADSINASQILINFPILIFCIVMTGYYSDFAWGVYIRNARLMSGLKDKLVFEFIEKDFVEYEKDYPLYPKLKSEKFTSYEVELVMHLSMAKIISEQHIKRSVSMLVILLLILMLINFNFFLAGLILVVFTYFFEAFLSNSSSQSAISTIWDIAVCIYRFNREEPKKCKDFFGSKSANAVASRSIYNLVKKFDL